VRSKLPKKLQDILRDPEERKKLVVYINPPYAEVGSNPGSIGKVGVEQSLTHDRYQDVLKVAGKELFAQFLMRIYCEIPQCTIANFSKLKVLQGAAFLSFRNTFRAKLERLFLVPASTFDNVNGQFPIGFFIWNTAKKEVFSEIVADVYERNGSSGGIKTIRTSHREEYINRWISAHKVDNGFIGFLAETNNNDFQHNKNIRLINSRGQLPNPRGIWVGEQNLVPAAVYLAVRHCIAATWLNDRDQFLYPNDSWEKDIGFHNDSLVFALFHAQNRISEKEGTNYWIPFTEDEVGATSAFESTFMADFIAGKIKKTNGNGDLFNKPKVENGTKCRFSPEAQAVFNAGREIWKYYHAHNGENPDTGIAFDANASLYDIRAYFQGRGEKGTMNARSADGRYTELIGILREKMNILADKIAEKVYEHGFLRG